MSLSALPAYRDYLRAANAVKVRSNYEQATLAITGHMRNALATRSLAGAAAFPADAAAWITTLQLDGYASPTGAPAYVAGAAVDADGSVGISAAGSFAANDAVVVVTRPADRKSVV